MQIIQPVSAMHLATLRQGKFDHDEGTNNFDSTRNRTFEVDFAVAAGKVLKPSAMVANEIQSEYLLLRSIAELCAMVCASYDSCCHHSGVMGRNSNPPRCGEK